VLSKLYGLKPHKYRAAFSKGEILKEMRGQVQRIPTVVETLEELEGVREKFHEHLVLGVFESQECPLFEPFRQATRIYSEISFVMSFNESLKEALNMSSHMAVLYKRDMLAANESDIRHLEIPENATSAYVNQFIFDHFLLDVDIYCQHT
jgi:hypothetical protein